MASGEYQVLFRGELTGDHPEETVRQHLADLFGMPLQRIDALFSGKPVVVKKNVDQGTAERFEATFRRAGAVCEIRGPAGSPDASPGPDADGRAAGTDEPAAAESASAPAGGTARGATGSTAAAGDPNRTVVALDVPSSFEGLEIDDSGGPLAPGERPAPPSIDTAGLSLADEDAGPLDPREAPPPAEIDTSGLSMESLDED